MEWNALRVIVESLKELNHPNIIKYLKVDPAPDRQGINILLEHIAGGSVRNLLDKFGPLEEKVIRIYMRQILEGLKYLHKNDIVHNNLKCSNILVANEGTIKLSDFGIIKCVPEIESNSNSFKKSAYIVAKNSLYWTAPEVIENKGGEKSADIWSLGCLMYEMRTKNPPWAKSGNDPEKILKQMANSPNGPKLPRNAFSPLARSWLRRCIEKEPKKRATVEELLTDPFILQNDVTTNTQAETNLLIEEEPVAEERKPLNSTKDEFLVNSNPIVLERVPKSKGAEFAAIEYKPMNNSETKAKEQRRKQCEEALRQELERRNAKSN
jgi:serine/threonine protein kinase